MVNHNALNCQFRVVNEAKSSVNFVRDEHIKQELIFARILKKNPCRHNEFVLERKRLPPGVTDICVSVMTKFILLSSRIITHISLVSRWERSNLM